MYTNLTHDFTNIQITVKLLFKLNLHSYASGLLYINFKTSGGHTSKASDCGATASIHFSLK